MSIFFIKLLFSSIRIMKIGLWAWFYDIPWKYKYTYITVSFTVYFSPRASWLMTVQIWNVISCDPARKNSARTSQTVSGNLNLSGVQKYVKECVRYSHMKILLRNLSCDVRSSESKPRNLYVNEKCSVHFGNNPYVTVLTPKYWPSCPAWKRSAINLFWWTEHY